MFCNNLIRGLNNFNGSSLWESSNYAKPMNVGENWECLLGCYGGMRVEVPYMGFEFGLLP